MLWNERKEPYFWIFRRAIFAIVKRGFLDFISEKLLKEIYEDKKTLNIITSIRNKCNEIELKNGNIYSGKSKV